MNDDVQSLLTWARSELRDGKESTSESSQLCLLLAPSAEKGAGSRRASCCKGALTPHTPTDGAVQSRQNGWLLRQGVS